MGRHATGSQAEAREWPELDSLDGTRDVYTYVLMVVTPHEHRQFTNPDAKLAVTNALGITDGIAKDAKQENKQ